MREDLQPQRVRQPLVLRQGKVVAIHPRGSQLVRITFRDPSLLGFASAGFDDHVKVFFPAPGETVPQMPQLDAQGQPQRQPGVTLIARDYTPRRFDPQRGELELEFVLHGDGPGTQWAAQARIGQVLGFAGPRGSLVIPLGFDWHWLIGDGSAMPAIGRRLAELPADCQVEVILLTEDEQTALAMPCAARVTRHTLPGSDHAAPDAPLQQLLARLPIPPGEGFVWVAGELATVRAARQTLLARGIARERIRAASYWQRGAVAQHQTVDD